jgi:hypothetical protein
MLSFSTEHSVPRSVEGRAEVKIERRGWRGEREGRYRAPKRRGSEGKRHSDRSRREKREV